MADDKQQEIEDKRLDSDEIVPPSEPEAILPPKGFQKYFGFLSFIPRFFSHHKVLGIIISIVILIAIAGASAAYFLFWHRARPPAEAPLQYNVSYYPLPELKLSIKRDEESLSYLVIGLTLKLPAGVNVDDYHKKEHEILDALHIHFSSITLDNLGPSAARSLVSPVGLERLRQNIIRRLNMVLSPLKIESILFRKLITQ